MSKPLGAAELADRAAIEDVITRYANALDRRDYDQVATCFMGDATASFGGVELAPGRDGIMAFLNRMPAGTPSRHAGTHFITNILISLNGDEATAESYALACAAPAEGNGSAFLRMRGIRYSDRLVRDGEEWRIARRVHAADWEASAQSLPITPIKVPS